MKGLGARGRIRAGGGERGFTLVELLVVLVIVGLAATAVVLSVPPPGGSLAGEAERLAARAKAARDSALVEARAAALEVGPAGYRLERRERGEWRVLSDHEWSEGTAPELADGAAARTVFDPTGLADPLRLTLRRRDQRIAVEIGHDGTIAIRR